jgi:hypothetical protein
MKNKIITTVLAFLIIAPAVAQKQFKDEYKNLNCTIAATVKVSKATNILIDNYKKLLTPVGNNVCTSSNGTITASSTMPLSYYGGTGAAGTISFSSFVEGTDLLRTVFGSKQSEYDYYGVCSPKPIVWDASPNGVNHVFAAKIVTIPNFVAAGANAEFLKTTGVPIADIASLDCVKIEETNGYAAATENVNYNNMYSSKGILVKVTLKTGVQQYCYLINNYDTSGTLKWKD